MRLRLWSLVLVASIGTLAGGGCLRFGYGDRRGLIRSDSGVVDAGPAADGGATGPMDASQDSAVGSQAGSSAAGGSRAAAGGGSGGALSAGNGGAGGARAEPLDAGLTDPLDAGSDAGTDAGAADSGVVASQKCLERPGALFCDSFEAPDPDFMLWSYEALTNGTVARSTTRARTGQWSLRSATTQGAGTQARLATLELNKQMSGDAWVRFYNWVPSSVEIQQHFSIGIISEEDPPWNGFEVRILNGDIVDLNTASALVVVDGVTPKVTYTRDAWVCVEMHVFIDAIAGFYEAYLDSTLAVRSPMTDTTTASGYSAAEVGVHYAPTDQGPVELFVDDVVVARSRIGCD
jgi:hypothetical protein